MAKKPTKEKTTKKPAKKQIATLTHDGAKRTNIPTAEYQPVVPKEQQAPVPVAYPRKGPGGLEAEIAGRNRDLDPQLVWRGKDEQDWSDLIVHAPPLYIQEKLHPKVLVEDLRRQSEIDEIVRKLKSDDPGPIEEQLDLFADFNGLPDTDAKTEFYQHEANWTNRMILGDSLAVMASLAEREGLRGRVQCIYIDPPYGIKFNSNFQWSTTSRDVKDGKVDHITREPEQVRAFRDTWRDGIHSYLTYLRDRLMVARDLLHESGSVFVQIGDENVHRVRELLDEVFGDDNFVSLISFKTSIGLGAEVIDNTTNYVLWYGKSESIKYRSLYHQLTPGGEGASRYKTARLPDLSEQKLRTDDLLTGNIPEHARLFRDQGLTSRSASKTTLFPVPFQGRTYRPSSGGWRTSETGMQRTIKADRVLKTGNNISFRKFFDDFGALGIDNFWADVSGGITSRSDPKIYVVQTSTKIVERCILMATDPGDLVLDPTCGSGTTAYVAEQWGRRWITIDTSRVALALARARIMGARYPYYLLADSREGQLKDAEVTQTEPSTASVRGNIRHGFVYQRVPHITLKSIANNAEIDVIWEKFQKRLEPLREQLNAALGTNWEEWEIPRELSDVVLRRAGLIPPDGDSRTAGGDSPTARGEARPQSAGTPTSRGESRTPRGEARIANGESPTHDGETRISNGDAPKTANGGVLSGTSISAVRDLHARWWEQRIQRQKEIDASIAAKADHEYLYDKPYDDKKKVRVAGPFTVESLSPHRTLGVDENDELIDPLRQASGSGRVSERSAVEDFAQMVLEHLKTAGVQQAHKEDRITFTSITPWPGHFICAEGRYSEGAEGNGSEKRAGIFIGPEFGTVSRQDLVLAAREAGDADFDVVVACAFNYEAHASEFDKLGRVRVLKARMNAELHMGGDLKNTGKGNLFVIFGEPDIDILDTEAGQIQVKINGVDVFHPNTGEVRSDGAEGIACWFIDTDYNEESFFVRHAYFLGASDPYKSLKTTLKAEINEEAWQSLHSDTSRPFDKPQGGRIAVKVINHLGDEVMKVFRVE